MIQSAPTDSSLPAYSGVYVFGDSLVDSGNALEAAELVARFPFVSLPEGAPVASNGYFEGRFTDGYNFADLISNKMLLAATRTTFPFGFEDPIFGIDLPFVGRPSGANLNFAYGGAQAIQGDEDVPDLNDQTDAYRKYPGADPNALYIVTIGANDVRELVPRSGDAVTGASASSRLSAAATAIRDEVGQLFGFGARHILVTGIPDLGLLPNYSGSANEAGRRSLATQYSRQLDALVNTALGGLTLPAGAELYPFSLIDFSNQLLANPDAYRLTNLTQARTVVQKGSLASTGSGFLFFDDVHPSAQVHALFAGAILDSLRGPGASADVAALQLLPAVSAIVERPGAVDAFKASLVAGRTYVFDLLGVSSGSGSLADPLLRLADSSGAALAADDDKGLGLDAHLQIVAPATADYALQVGGVGVVAGSYMLQARDVSGDSLVLTGALRGSDETVSGSASADTITAEAGGNSLSGGGGDDSLTGGSAFDTINGNTGADTVHGGDGADIVLGGQGSDSVYGDAGNDVQLNGNLGDDNVFGGPGDDLVYGGQGHDTLFGDDGNDWLSGDLGNDILYGGAGADRFLFRPGSGIDWVGDFNAGEGDRVQLATATTYTVTNSGGQVMISLGSNGEGIGLAGVSFAAFSLDWIALV